MKRAINLFLFSFFLFSTALQAQVKGVLKINHLLGSDPFAFNYTVQNNLGNTFKFTRFQYYLTKFSIVHDGNQITTIHEDTVALVNAADGPYTLVDLGDVSVTNVEGIIFHVGVHTPVNNADPALQPAGSPLAPQSPSMHWGWASGYRFAAIEGQGGASFALTFQIHALGNDNYFTTAVIPQSTNLSNDSLYINVNANYLESVRNIDVSNGLTAHGELDEAKVCLQNFQSYVFGQPFVSIDETKNEINFQVYPNPTSNSVVTLNVSHISVPFEIKLINTLGEIVGAYSNSNGSIIEINIPQKGIYMVQLTVSGYESVSQKIISL